MKHVVWILLVLLGLAALASYALDGDGQTHCDTPEWMNVDGYR